MKGDETLVAGGSLVESSEPSQNLGWHNVYCVRRNALDQNQGL